MRYVEDELTWNPLLITGRLMVAISDVSNKAVIPSSNGNGLQAGRG